jgi:hypothetical protein
MQPGTTNVAFVNETYEQPYESSVQPVNVQGVQTWTPTLNISKPAETCAQDADNDLVPSALFTPEVQQKLFRSREVLARAAKAYQEVIDCLGSGETGLPRLKDGRCWWDEETFSLEDAQRELHDKTLIKRLEEYVHFIDADRSEETAYFTPPRTGKTPLVGRKNSREVGRELKGGYPGTPQSRGTRSPQLKAQRSPPLKAQQSPTLLSPEEGPNARGQTLRPLGETFGSDLERLDSKRDDFENGYRARGPGLQML